MYRLRLFGITVLAVFAVGGAVASTASALLPTILFLTGQTSILLFGSNTEVGAVKFGSIALPIVASKITVELTALNNDTKLGPVLFEFLEFESGQVPCESPGAGAGNMHVTGEWHLVYTGLGASLNIGLLILVKYKFICGEANLSMEGSLLLTVNPGTVSEGDITEVGSQAECEGANANKAVHPKYENQAGTVVEASLLGVVSGIKEKWCAAFKREIRWTPRHTGQMIKLDL